MPPGARSDGQWIVVWWFGGQWCGWVAGDWWWPVGDWWFCNMSFCQDHFEVYGKFLEIAHFIATPV